MIKSAKVSLYAVKKFEQSVASIRDFTPQFDKSMACFEDLIRILSEQTNVVRECIGNMKSAQNSLANKIREIKDEIAGITAVLNKLEGCLHSLKSELSTMPKLFVMTDSEGMKYEIPNPMYAALEAQIDTVKSEISDVNDQLSPLQQRLNRANTIDGQLSSKIDFSNSIISSLQEKQNSCKRYRGELEEIRNLNLRNGLSAVDSLKQIEKIISAYLRIRMTYDSASLQEQNIALHGKDVNINFPIDNAIGYGNDHTKENLLRKNTISEEDIRKHQIRFDDSGRISAYDNKTFGGRYNTYETRLSRTSAEDNPIWGHYEGVRGESKYVPSGRTVEGVIVIGILEKYGLDGIEYRNAEPDFEVCAESVVKIKAMSENRENYYDSNGNPTMGNFAQADIECAKMWNEQKRDGRDDWSGRDVLEYRRANNLTWHEKCDTETMVLVRSEINLYFKHSGGCSECRMRDGVQVGGEFDE